ncbi:MAG TPA: methyl-accepting chemotaxis protein [Dyella sp.]|uniref:methyl-accepting chemotaxis protein n=1 Tax=Dyella sp. TaxID=1869338 RepID=UPI002F932882
MKRRFTLTIRNKLILGLGLCALIMLGVSWLGIHGQGQSNANTSDIYLGDVQPILDIAKVRQGTYENRVTLGQTLSMRNAAEVAASRSKIAADNATIDQAWAAYYPLISSDRERHYADAFAATRQRTADILQQILALAADGRFDEALKLQSQTYTGLFREMMNDIDVLYEENQNQAADSYRSSQRSYAHTRLATLTALALGLGLVCALLVVMIRAISRPIDRAVALADAIASGELNHRIAIARNDEIGRLMLALQRMDSQLTRIVREVRNGATSVASASRQISQGNDDLSQRTQEQASSLEETATSMEEMTTAVRQNADHAYQAAQLVGGALDRAEHGGHVVNEAMTAMDTIRRSSERIADIVGMVDEVAFQTNLLALNAAVEAARAGEHGRGFAVVASEVRALAQRSAGFSREIRSLVQEEKDKVDMGSLLVNASGDALNDILARMRKIAELVAHVTQASEEQSAGIDQVNRAVAQLDETTQQNAALVEEAAAASRALQEQAAELMEQVNFFRIDTATATPVATRHTEKIVALETA